jgi:hypothetical protein
MRLVPRVRVRLPLRFRVLALSTTTPHIDTKASRISGGEANARTEKAAV